MQIKHLLFIVILIIALGTLFWWWMAKYNPTENTPLKPKHELSIVAVGDSLVAGVGATPGNDFVTLLSKKIGVPIRNEGVAGNTSSQLLARMDDILESDPDIIILLVGGNDALQKIPLEKTFHNISAIIQAAQSEGSSVVLIGIQGNIIGSKYQKQFDILAKEYKTVYVPDILDGLIGDNHYMSDAVHPNDQGYVQIADKIYKEMKKIDRRF